MKAVDLECEQGIKEDNTIIRIEALEKKNQALESVGEVF